MLQRNLQMKTCRNVFSLQVHGDVYDLDTSSGSPPWPEQVWTFSTCRQQGQKWRRGIGLESRKELMICVEDPHSYREILFLHEKLELFWWSDVSSSMWPGSVQPWMLHEDDFYLKAETSQYFCFWRPAGSEFWKSDDLVKLQKFHPADSPFCINLSNPQTLMMATLALLTLFHVWKIWVPSIRWGCW